MSSFDHVNSDFVCFFEAVTDGRSVVGSAATDSFDDDAVISIAISMPLLPVHVGDGLHCQTVTA